MFIEKLGLSVARVLAVTPFGESGRLALFAPYFLACSMRMLLEVVIPFVKVPIDCCLCII